ncbi:DUF4332 domain-containing protein [Rhodocaloribacter litoris]|uniref:DUF4332 domain-containing protein n=1 Tax=Rhodocaloribacter litoris TaxID=2558931 RepID=UPI00142003FA|nr:DUF4332 domain-containing protein [Rhodocaloribacter litoris]QXD17029.1 DUF4332 domain-containing protein [Rhodocaloribacter litoris]
MATLTTIEGIGEALAEKFKQAGVGSVEKLLEKGSTAKGRKELAEATGIDASRILRFVNHADLMRLKGVGGEYAELLEAAGVDTVAELARRNAANLHAKMVEVNEQKKLVRQVPVLAQVEAWIAQAKEMPKVVTHG